MVIFDNPGRQDCRKDTARGTTLRIAVHVKPGAKQPGIERLDDTLIVRVRERAEKGKANAACARALAEHFGVPPSHVRMIRGATSREKLFEVTVS